jgi:hypothetical protein
MRIIQITAVKERPRNKSPYDWTTVFGLGADGLMYFWDVDNGIWEIFIKEK